MARSSKRMSNLNLVFKFKYGKEESKQHYIALKYRLEGETKTSISYLADKREDEWLIAKLYQFTNDGTAIDLEIIFEDDSEWLLIDCIEFQPVKKVEHEISEDNNVDVQIMSDQDTYWEQKLPNDYEHIIEWAKDDVKWTTKEELLINKGQEWFSLDKNGKKCVMLSPRVARVISGPDPTCQSSHKSRQYNYGKIGEALKIDLLNHPEYIEHNATSASIQNFFTFYSIFGQFCMTRDIVFDVCSSRSLC